MTAEARAPDGNGHPGVGGGTDDRARGPIGGLRLAIQAQAEGSNEGLKKNAEGESDVNRGGSSLSDTFSTAPRKSLVRDGGSGSQGRKRKGRASAARR